jgi:hypothetical protein
MTYETILTCPKCGFEYRLVAENVVAERDRLAEAARAVCKAYYDAGGDMTGELGETLDALDIYLASIWRETSDP